MSLHVCEGGSFSTAIFNGDIQLIKGLLTFVFYVRLSVCRIVKSNACRKFEHCFVLSTLKSGHFKPLVCFDLFSWTLAVISVFASFFFVVVLLFFFFFLLFFLQMCWKRTKKIFRPLLWQTLSSRLHQLETKKKNPAILRLVLAIFTLFFFFVRPKSSGRLAGTE